MHNDTSTWQKSIESTFTFMGMSEKEARVYRILLDMGQGKPSLIAQKAGLKRGITYAVLETLRKNGLVEKIQKEGKTLFQSLDPQRLVNIVSDKKKQIDTVESSLEEIIPKLRSQYKLAIGKPTIRFYEGEEGLKSVFNDIYAPKNEPVWGCVDLERANEVFPSYIADKLIPKRIQNKVKAISILADSPQAKEVSKKDKEQLRESILVDKATYPLPAEIDVYEDKIAMLSFSRGDFIGIIIENHDLAESLKSLFRIACTRNSRQSLSKNAGRQSGTVKNI